MVQLNQAPVKIRQSVTTCFSYHGTLGPTVQEAAGRFFVEAVVGSRSFGHLLHDHLGLDVLLCSGIYCDVRPLKTHRCERYVHISLLIISNTQQRQANNRLQSIYMNWKSKTVVNITLRKFAMALT